MMKVSSTLTGENSEKKSVSKVCLECHPTKGNE